MKELKTNFFFNNIHFFNIRKAKDYYLIEIKFQDFKDKKTYNFDIRFHTKSINEIKTYFKEKCFNFQKLSSLLKAQREFKFINRLNQDLHEIILKQLYFVWFNYKKRKLHKTWIKIRFFRKFPFTENYGLSYDSDEITISRIKSYLFQCHDIIIPYNKIRGILEDLISNGLAFKTNFELSEYYYSITQKGLEKVFDNKLRYEEPKIFHTYQDKIKKFKQDYENSGLNPKEYILTKKNLKIISDNIIRNNTL